MNTPSEGISISELTEGTPDGTEQLAGNYSGSTKRGSGYALAANVNPKISPHDPAGSYTILDDDGFTHFPNSATGTITLPTLAANYNRIITIIRDVADSTTPLIIDGEGAETIAGNASEHLYGKYAVMSLMASEDAGEWVYVGKPYDPYVLTFESNSDTPITTPSSNTWYNPSSHEITLLAGAWYVSYSTTVYNLVSTAAEQLRIFTTLSTANNSESQKDYTVFSRTGLLTSLCNTLQKNTYDTTTPIITVSSDTTYYLNIKGVWAGTNSYLGTLSNTQPAMIKASRAF